MVTPCGNKGKPGERDNARNNARCMQARKAMHGCKDVTMPIHIFSFIYVKT